MENPDTIRLATDHHVCNASLRRQAPDFRGFWGLSPLYISRGMLPANRHKEVASQGQDLLLLDLVAIHPSITMFDCRSP